MEVADHIALMHQGRIEQVGRPRDVYDRPANEFVMGFLGPVTQVGDQLVRPHELRLSPDPIPGGVEAMVARVVHLGFEVRVELELPGGERAYVQLTRAQTEELELRTGDVVYLRAPAAAPDAAALSG